MLPPFAAECAARHLLHQRVVPHPVALGRLDPHVQLVARPLAVERFLETRDYVALPVQVGERLAAGRAVEHLSGVVGQRVVDEYDLVLCD